MSFFRRNIDTRSIDAGRDELGPARRGPPQKTSQREISPPHVLRRREEPVEADSFTGTPASTNPPHPAGLEGYPPENWAPNIDHLVNTRNPTRNVDATTRRHIEENGRTEGSRGKTTADRPSERASSPIRYAPHGCWCGVRPGPPHHQGTVGIPGWVGGKAIRRGSPSLIQNGIGHLASTDEPRHTLH